MKNYRLTAATSLLALGAMAATLTHSNAAHAETAIAGDLDYAAPIDSKANGGGGFGVRLGSYMKLPAIAVTPEIGFTYHGFGGDYGPKLYRGIAGLRLGIGEILQPGVFAHIGLGALKGGVPESDTHTALTWDAGAYLDLTLLPVLNIGVHASYNKWTGGSKYDSFEYGVLGANAALIF